MLLRPARRFAAAAAALAIGTAIAVLGAEAVLRSAGDRLLPQPIARYSQLEQEGYVINGTVFRTLPFWRADDYYSFKLKDNLSLHVMLRDGHSSFSLHSNEIGFRFPMADLNRPARHRVMVLGDSVAFGHGVNDDQTLPNRLNALFAESDVRFLNFAVGAWSFGEYYLTYQRYAAQVQPSLIVVVVYAGNDFYELERSEWTGRDKGSLPAAPLTRLDYAFDSDGQLINEGLAYKFPVLRESVLWIAIDKFLLARLREAKHARRLATYPRSTMETSLDVLRAIGKRHPTLVVVIPFQDKAAPIEFMRRIQISTDVAVLDLHPLVHELKSDEEAYLSDHVHFAAKGNEMVARTIGEFIRSRGLIAAIRR